MSSSLRLAFAILVAVFMASEAQAGKRIALVIGNSAYTAVSPLANPKNDADLMAKTLQSVGFEVTKLTDADQRAMKQAMLDFGRKLHGGVDAGLFYYSGHGVQAKGEDYLIPVDAAIKDEGELDLQAIDVNAFLQVMDNADSKVNIIILDACRNNPFAASARSATRGLAMLAAPRGTYIAFSTGINQVAEDGDGKDSPYTEALAKAMVKPGVKLEDAFKEARRTVEAATDNKQVPWETTSITGDFYFRPAVAQLPAPQPAPQPPAPQPPAPSPAPQPALGTDNTVHWAGPPVLTADDVAWMKLVASTDPAAIGHFIQLFPTSSHAAAARVRLTALTATGPAVTNVAPGANSSSTKGTFVQLAAWPSPVMALDRFHKEQQRFPLLLGDKQPHIDEETSRGQIVYRVRVGPFANVDQAGRFCSILTDAGGACHVSAQG